jgi:hypothetical protein
LRRDLKLPDGVREDVVDQLCLTLLDKVANFTEILGFILRSTNVRNPFELHFIVKKLITRALGEEVNLLISSEWAYVPFTYPLSVDQLPGFILIGTPAPESGNPLLIPLAGHEVGHSAWRVFECTPKYSAAVSEKIKQELDRNPKAAKELIENATLGELDRARVTNQCAAHVMQQLEEIFCDLFGLYLFGHAYIAAFDYLLGPGGHDRDLDYPSDQQRMAILVDAARDRRIRFDETMIERWTSTKARRSERAAAEIIDAVTLAMIPQLRADLFAEFEQREISVPQEGLVDDVLAAFERGEPYPDRVELGEIVSAGWLRLRALDDMPSSTDYTDEEEIARQRTKNYKVLADLILKTVEVAEYHDRVTAHA